MGDFTLSDFNLCLMVKQVKPVKYQTRLSLGKLTKVNKDLKINDTLCNAVKGTGFEAIANIQINTLDRKLIKWLLLSYDPTESIMNVHDWIINVTDYEVGRALGIPASGDIIEIDPGNNIGLVKYGSFRNYCIKERGL